MYPKEIIDPIKQEIIDNGLINLETPKQVNNFIEKNKKYNAVLFVNSVCGCAAGIARPGLYASFTHKLSPIKKKRIGTVFAGVDKEATQKAREYILGYSPSSPAIAFYRQGELVHFLERHNIETLELSLLKELIESIYAKFFSEQINQKIEVSNPLEKIKIDINQLSDTFTLLDCRGTLEREQGTIPNSLLLDQNLADQIIQNESTKKKLLFFCENGETSIRAALYFKKKGFINAFSLRGGYAAYKNINN